MTVDVFIVLEYTGFDIYINFIIVLTGRDWCIIVLRFIVFCIILTCNIAARLVSNSNKKGKER